MNDGFTHDVTGIYYNANAVQLGFTRLSYAPLRPQQQDKLQFNDPCEYLFVSVPDASALHNSLKSKWLGFVSVDEYDANSTSGGR
jgi:hypothetical protein